MVELSPLTSTGKFSSRDLEVSFANSTVGKVESPEFVP